MSKSKKIVFFTQLYYPDMTTTAILMTDLAEDLANLGLNVQVVSAQPTYLVKKRSPKKEIHNNVEIHRVWSFLFDKNNNIGRLLNGISCFLSMLLYLFKTHPNDILIFNTNPALLPYLGYVANKLRKQRVVILIHDLWPELPANIGLIKKDSLIYKIIDYLLTLAYRRAAKIVVLSDAMRKVVSSKISHNMNKIEVIHNWADKTRIFPVPKEKNSLLRKINPEGRKIVMYSGNLGRYQPLEVMLEAAVLLRNREDILFLFVGNGAKKPKLEAMASKANLNNVLFLPFQPLDKLAESLSMADISLLGIEPQNEGVIMPSKLYGLLAVGKPIICVSAPDSEVAQIIEGAKAGVQVSPDDPESLVEKILFFLENPDQAKKMGENGLNYFEKNFERKIITKQWYNLLSNIS